MSDEDSDWDTDCDEKCKEKKSKSNVAVDQNPNQIEEIVAGPSNDDSPSSIYKMDIDCFEELFEYLSVYNLLKLRCICKRFKKIIDYYIRTNYPKVGKFKLNNENFDMFRQMDAGTIGLIREINVSIGSEFDGVQFSAIKEILNKVKKITIMKWETNSDFYDCFLKYCKNVKWLSMEEPTRYGPNSTNMTNEWLKHSYPSIEYFGITNIWKEEIDDYVKFFHLNSNIHALSIELFSLDEIGLDLIAAGIKFNRLYSDECYTDINHQNILERLYNAKFYKRLCFKSRKLYAEIEDDHSKLAFVGTEVLNLNLFNFIIPSLPSLKELNIQFNFDFESFERSENVENVIKRFRCNSIHSDNLLAFIGNFPKVKYFEFGDIYGANILNLIEMNKERRKLTGACKTIIYVHEDIFLATKWAKTETKFDLIEIKRIQTYDWKEFFENYCELCAP